MPKLIPSQDDVIAFQAMVREWRAEGRVAEDDEPIDYDPSDPIYRPPSVSDTAEEKKPKHRNYLLQQQEEEEVKLTEAQEYTEWMREIDRQKYERGEARLRARREKERAEAAATRALLEKGLEHGPLEKGLMVVYDTVNRDLDLLAEMEVMVAGGEASRVRAAAACLRLPAVAPCGHDADFGTR